MASSSTPPDMTRLQELCKCKELLISVIQTLDGNPQPYLECRALHIPQMVADVFIPAHTESEFEIVSFSIDSLRKGGPLQPLKGKRRGPHEVLFEIDRVIGPNCIALLLLNFYGIKLTSILDQIDPLELVQSCWELWCELYDDDDDEEHVHEQRLHFIISNCIEKYFKDKVIRDDDTKTAMKQLEEEFKPFATHPCRNEGLMEYLLEKDRLHHHAIMETMHTHAWIYCDEHIEERNSYVRAICPQMVSADVPKSEVRLAQKFREYEALYIRPRVNVYAEFKDLFRGSVSMDVLLNNHNLRAELKKLLVEVKLTVSDQICDLKLILAIKGDKFELKVLPCGAAEPKWSHAFYELQRDKSLGNILDFIARSLKKEAKKNRETKSGGKRLAVGDPEDCQEIRRPPQPEGC